MNAVKVIVRDGKNEKICASESYNYLFRKTDGFFMRWGKVREDDPQFAPFPEILDIEVTTKCSGIPNIDGIKVPCKFCYKENGPIGENMSLETFKTILDKFPNGLTQIAIGADAEATSNPDLFKMMEYARSKGIIPNITVANITDETADKLASLCGAVAVSRYANKNVCYDTIKRLTDRGMKQINIHMMVSQETYQMCLETIKDRVSDPRLAKMNAIVFLSLKKKGRGERFHPLETEKYNAMVEKALDAGIAFGMDSCSAPKFLKAIAGRPDAKKMETFVEPCESSLFSSYINTEGKFFPCSFCEGAGDWKEGIDVTACEDFTKDVWNHPRVLEFKKKLLNCQRNCPVFEV